MKMLLLSLISFVCFSQLHAQLFKDSIHTDFVLNQRRVRFDTYLRDKTIREAFALPLDSNTEYDYESACLAISQFMLQSPEIKSGLDRMMLYYDSLQNSVKRALLEVVFELYPLEYAASVRKLLLKETLPKLFAMESLYLLHADNTNAAQSIFKQMQFRFPDSNKIPVLVELKKHIIYSKELTEKEPPSFRELFAYQKNFHQKTIYSFQRWNRDYPGIAIIQDEDGNFMRDGAGELLMFEQLARSASNLPYFITNGNTPQGIFSVTGVEVTHNNFIGPTPTIQLVMPFENDSAYWHVGYDSSKDALQNYLNLAPPSWRLYQPIKEAFYAGKIGRSEIIAHGTTLDPVYFKGKPFYPLTPTLGCLCAKETWNIYNGKLIESEQFNLVSAFLSTPDSTGYLFVININNENKPIAREEIKALIKESQ